MSEENWAKIVWTQLHSGGGGRCGERAVCEELGETKWTDDADGDDMESMSPGLIHGKTACEKASRGTAGEETPKKLSEPAISRRANVANQEEWFGCFFGKCDAYVHLTCRLLR